MKKQTNTFSSPYSIRSNFQSFSNNCVLKGGYAIESNSIGREKNSDDVDMNKISVVSSGDGKYKKAALLFGHIIATPQPQPIYIYSICAIKIVDDI